VTKLGQELIKGLKEAISHEKGQTMLKVVEIKKPEEKKQQPARRPIMRRDQAPARALISKRTKNIYKVRLPRLSPKEFVESFRSGPFRAGEFAAEIANGLKKSIAENDITNMPLAKQKKDLGFWLAAAAYGARISQK
jgi:hypothetical protein